MFNIKSLIVIIALVVSAIISLVFFAPTSAHVVSKRAVVSHNPQSIVATPPQQNCHVMMASHQPCIHAKSGYQTPLHFTHNWSQPVNVALKWQLTYICDGASQNDQYEVWNSQGWMIIRAGLTCDNALHTVPFEDAGNRVQVVVSRAVDAVIGF